MASLRGFDSSQNVNYHYGGFPPVELDYTKIAAPLADAAAAIARYGQMLKGIHNARLFMTPLQRQEAIASSRMEGTVSTLEELLEYEANLDDDGTSRSARRDTLEVYAYRHAMHSAVDLINDGAELSPDLLRECHRILLGFTRGSDRSPGQFKTEQNYLVDMVTRSIRFTPISPDRLEKGLNDLFLFIRNSEVHPLIKTAVAHVEFESLHPFNDGNGRVGRIFITLMLWKLGQISSPYFYISGYLEKKKSDYVDCMRAVSSGGDWTTWCIFFLEAVREQAEINVAKSEEIRELYERMKEIFRDKLASKWSITALDFIFGTPVFRNTTFINRSGIPKRSAKRVVETLLDAGLLAVSQHSSGRRSALYAFRPLLQIVRE